jgi:lysozyme family protein
MAVDLAALQRKNDTRWKNLVFTRSPLDFDARAKIAYRNKWRYIEIIHRLQKLGSTIPDDAWPFLAAIHERESSMDFNTSMGQGDPLTNKQGVPIKSVHVPANRGPFTGPDAFEQAAVDSLWYCSPYAAKVNKDWSISGQLTYLERYNGLGYAMRGIPSPYLWAGTNQYTSGKFIHDGPSGFSATARDTQLGVAGFLKRIDLMDTTIIHVDAPEVSLQPTLPESDQVPAHGVHDAVWLQWALNELRESNVPLTVDGIPGSSTRNAVRAFQRQHELQADGIAGTTETIPAIVASLESLKLPEFPVAVDAH